MHIVLIATSVSIGLLTSCDSKKPNEYEKPITTSSVIDSTKLQVKILGERYNCDTTTLFDYMELTVTKNKILRDYSRNRLIPVLVSDIYDDEDEKIILTGIVTDMNFIGNKCFLKLDDELSIRGIPRHDMVYCVVNNLRINKIEDIQERSKSEKDFLNDMTKSNILNGDCIYIEIIK